MTQNGWIAVIVGIIVIGGGIWWFSSQQSAEVAVDNSTTLNGSTDTGSDTGTQTGVDVSVGTPPMTATVTYSGTSFTPATVTVAKGGTVTFVDASGRGMWVASGMHPTHTTYDGTSESAHCAAGYTGPKPFDQCKNGTTYSFAFDKTGEWGYHDHLHSSAFGKVVVQ